MRVDDDLGFVLRQTYSFIIINNNNSSTQEIKRPLYDAIAIRNSSSSPDLFRNPTATITRRIYVEGVRPAVFESLARSIGIATDFFGKSTEVTQRAFTDDMSPQVHTELHRSSQIQNENILNVWISRQKVDLGWFLLFDALNTPPQGFQLLVQNQSIDAARLSARIL